MNNRIDAIYARQSVDKKMCIRDRICSFLLQVEEQVAASSGHSHVAFCKNPVVNALIEYYYGMAQTQGTEFQVRLDLPDQIPLTDVELCTVLGLSLIHI